MYLPRPSLTPLIVFSNLSGYLDAFGGLGNVGSGVGVYGSAAAYALVWELGSRRLKNPGPKTLWSVNRDGQKAILTRQAPFGYVGIAVNQFWPIISGELAKVNFSSADAKTSLLRLQVAMENAAQKMATLIADIAPVDSGDLKSQIQPMDSDELGDIEGDFDSSGALFV